MRLCWGLSSAQQRGWRDRSEVSAQKFAPLYFPGRLEVEVQFRTQMQGRKIRSQASSKLKDSVWPQFHRISHRQTSNLPLFRVGGTLVHLERTEVLRYMRLS